MALHLRQEYCGIVGNLKKDYLWNSVGTSANAFISLLLSIAVTRINGIEGNGVFTFSFGFAILFFMIGLFGGRIYQVSDVRDEFESRTYIFLKFITSAAMLATAIFFILVNGYDKGLAALLLSLVVYKILDAIADPLYGVMQSKSRLYLAGVSMTLKAVIGFLAFVVVDILTHNIFWSSLCLLSANLVFITVFDIPKVRRLEKVGRLLHGNLKSSLVLLRTSVYIFAFAFCASLLVNIPRYFVEAHLSQSDLGIFGIVIMPATMLNLFVQYVIQPKLVPLSEHFADRKYASFGRTVTRLILISISFGAIAILAAWLVGCPVLSLIYGEDLYPFRTGLTLVVLAGTTNMVTMIYSNILSVMRRFRIQLFNYLVGTISIFTASAALVSKGSMDGAILAFVIANAVQAALFLVSYQAVFRKLRRSS